MTFGAAQPSRSNQLCIYCGTRPADSVDHVPPRCLFKEPRPSNLYTVPCCRDCNEAFALHDEYFRTAIAFRWDVADHPAVGPIVQKALRSTARSPRFRELFTRTLKEASIVTHGGIYVEQGGQFEVDGRRIELVLARIVRGLHFKKTGTALPPSARVAAFADETLLQADPRARHELLLGWAPITQGNPEIFGDEAFLFFHKIEPGSLQSSWLLVFFSKVIYYAVAGIDAARIGEAPSA